MLLSRGHDGSDDFYDISYPRRQPTYIGKRFGIRSMSKTGKACDIKWHITDNCLLIPPLDGCERDLVVQESRAAARKPRDAASILFG